MPLTLTPTGLKTAKGYRLLDDGETIQPQDQYWIWAPPQNGWAAAPPLMCGHPKPPGISYRRKIQPQPIPC